MTKIDKDLIEQIERNRNHAQLELEILDLFDKSEVIKKMDLVDVLFCLNKIMNSCIKRFMTKEKY